MEIEFRNQDLERRVSELEQSGGSGGGTIDDSDYARLSQSNTYEANQYFNGNVFRVGARHNIGEILLHGDITTVTGDHVVVRGTQTGSGSTVHVSSKVTEIEGIDQLTLKGNVLAINAETRYNGSVDNPLSLATKQYVDALEERVRHLERLMQGLGVE